MKMVIGPAGLKRIERIRKALEDDPLNETLQKELAWWMRFKADVEATR